MKLNIIHSIVGCLVAFTLPFMMASCGNQEESLPEIEGSLFAIFTLDLGDTEAYGTTRATPTDGEYTKGSGLENVIDFPGKDFRCYLFGTDNVFISTLDVMSIYNLGGEEQKKYQIRSRLKNTEEVKKALTDDCRFVFLANWSVYPEPVPGKTKIADLCSDKNAIFNFSQQKTLLSDNNLIPMYGVKEFEDGVKDFKEGKELSDIGTVHLLRAFAKVEVNITFEDFAETPVVTSVTLTHSNNEGFKAPANVTKEGQYVTGSWLTDYTPVHIPADAEDLDQLELTKDESTGHYVAYVPEYKNVDENKEPLNSSSRIKINFTIGDVKVAGLDVESFVDFCYSDNPSEGVTPGQHFDIARNNWYKFDVIAKGKDIVWTVDVIPFTSVELKPPYGLVRDDFTGYIIGKDSKGMDCWYDGNYYDTEKAVPLYLGPKGHEGQSVTINGKEYLLVYADYGLPSQDIYKSGFERTAINLDHIIDKETRKKYFLEHAKRTGYTAVLNPEHPEWGPDLYITDRKQIVWLDEDYMQWAVVQNSEGRDEWVCTVGKWYRTLNEWDRLDWNRAFWDKEVRDPRIYPRFWFDILGNRYPWSEGDTKEKRAAILGDWTTYLE